MVELVWRPRRVLGPALQLACRARRQSRLDDIEGDEMMTISGLEADRSADDGRLVIHGHELDPGQGDASIATMLSRGWRGIQLCYCVWDSPESPCACMHDRRWWFPNVGILTGRRTSRKDHDGRALQEFEISAGTPVLVEMSVETLIKEAKKQAASAKA